MTCASCSHVIEENVRRLPGVEKIQVNFATEKAEVVSNDKFNEDSFKELLVQLGYRAINPDSLKTLPGEKNPEQEKLLFQSILSLIAGAISMALSMGPFSQILSHELNNILQFLISAVILILFGRKYIKAIGTLIKTGHSGMNTLIGLGISAAFLYSVALMIISIHAHVYFETIPFILGFTLFGHYLDDKAKTKARASLSSLYKMQIKFALKIVEGKEISTPVIELKAGDILRLKPGDKIPLDSVVISGTSHADESMITGESVPVSKNTGDKVFAGSLNLEGSLTVEVKQEIHQTYIANIVSFVEKAQLKKAPIEKYADQVIRYFVPAIILISIVTFISWWFFNQENKSFEAFSHMIAVLLIACPCALGLAVPMAVMLSTAQASKKGLLIGGGDVIEKGSSINTVVFDKTGTLTEGSPVVTHFETAMNDEKEFLRIAGSIVQYSNHPLSGAISKFVANKEIKISDPDKFKNLPGMGMESFFENKRILVGKKELLEQNNIAVDKVLSGSLVYFGIDNMFAGVFVIEDPVKKTAASTVATLRDNGIEVWMLTGDNAAVAEKIAAEIGIVNIKANVLPVEKAEFVTSLKAQGKKVAMIGDGINDAPALTNADLSMAMAGGSDVAIEAADVSILEGKIECVADFFKLSRQTMSIIKQNLFLSFFYNFLCIPLAAGVLWPWLHISLTPMWASLAMGLSSVSVVLSSLRLRRTL
jgi:Cu+-exporting ATPase